MAWDLHVDRTDLEHVEVVDGPDPEPGPGDVVLRVDRVGVSANNVTYAVVGDDLGYWSFFPTAEATWGRVPHWGFADVVASTVDGVAEGARVYGYVPPGSHLVVRPDRVTAAGFRDAAPHRRPLPGAYNAYVTTAEDPLHAHGSEDVQVLFRPLFMLALMLSDHLLDAGCFGADAVVISSASSKTSAATAALLDGVRTVGLTSAGNRDFVAGLGCYDEVVTYDALDDLAATGAVYVDVAGDATLRRRVHERVEPVHSTIVGATHHAAGADPAGGEDLPGAAPAFFFTPDHLRRRAADWGPDGLARRTAEAWAGFAPRAEGWVEVVRGHGPTGLADAWRATVAGATPPSQAHVVDLG